MNSTKEGVANPALSLDEEADVGMKLDGQLRFRNKETSDPVPKTDNLEQNDSKIEFDDLPYEPGQWTKRFDSVSETVKAHLEKNKTLLKRLVLAGLFILYNIYFICAIHFAHENLGGISRKSWCDGVGFLIIWTIIIYSCMLYFLAVKPAFNMAMNTAPKFQKTVASISERTRQILSIRFIVPAITILVYLAIFIFVIVDSLQNHRRIISFFGLHVLIFLGLLMSKHPNRVRWRHILWGLFLQFIFGLLILRWSVGQNVFQCLGDKISTFLAYTDEGSSFVFGYLVNQQPFPNPAAFANTSAFEVANVINDKRGIGFVFMFKVLSVIYFFSFFVSMLFYLGAMQWLVMKIGWMLQVTVGTTACESMNAAGNIFLGQSEAPLMIKPYLPRMTNSELHAVMTGGFATIAGSVMAAYISFDVSPSHLLSASVMSAPAALAIAKLMYPETKQSKTTAASIESTGVKSEDVNILDAAGNGAVTAVYLVANIGATLVAFLAFVGFMNGVLSWFGDLVGWSPGDKGLTFEYLLGKIFIPMSWIMGVEEEDLEPVGVLIGMKTIVNEFAAYGRLKEYVDAEEISERSKTIATYALCGFSNPASIGIQIAALGTMAPERRADLSRIAFRAFIAGSMACFCTACIAGCLLDS